MQDSLTPEQPPSGPLYARESDEPPTLGTERGAGGEFGPQAGAQSLDLSWRGDPIPCPHCDGCPLIPPTHWTKHLQRHHPEAPMPEATSASPWPNVQGRCPACHGQSLFLGDGGYVTCARLECPEPDAASTLLEGQATPAVTVTVHRRQPLGSGLMPCCGRSPAETPGDRQTTNPEQVTCGRSGEADGPAVATDNPAPELREQIAEALMAWAERNNAPQYAAMRRPDTVRQNAYSRADAVLAVPAIQQLQAEIGRLEIANRALNQAALEAIERAEKAEAANEQLQEQLARVREWLPVISRALSSLPETCRYHGDQLDPDRFGRMTRSEACCDTGIPARRRREAEQALAALDPQEQP